MLDRPTLLSKLSVWKTKGYKKLRNGTELIAILDPVNMPDYWFHAIYAPLTQGEIDEFQKELELHFPKPYQKLLLQFNGIRLFGLELFIFGKEQFTKNMSYDEQTNQPKDLEDERSCLIGDIPNDLFYFARRREDTFFFLNSQEKVLGVDNEGYLVGEWHNIDEWFKAQILELNNKHTV
ncbi:SMI1/KNR4 family protein [Anoxybacillus rupiensis]|jgi:SMI1 / KNR4 family (SUKH-1)|uniref:SMI1/KNR4 family protein n=1 Tax=Anoxybacteroides rupiense TaxID=311460 RepID=A0ABT5W8T1_9BACL|nr:MULTISPECIES: SMI1/KNR4 family protein [Anoxybacillus]MBS2773200.1 SMI1/KNR4 family protein [Anoxybacillus rupiensis]MDE8565724.1 SMI1/KNR4 family protein [Anoxybacillus rupiensis]OQM44372.1 hypothetical protein B6A27_17385 [Anoxybacillus sp. UARK-01]QHC05302.1 hypothetical protein GRQ40_16115 [Anoxybacillus sp. PDR2]